jgi:ABC-2 type transport system ATP-binding protein
MAAIRVRDLRKTYGSLEAVRGVDFDVAEGEVFGFLGPNGAGKTTIVEILEGYRQRTSGEVTVLGHDPAKGDRALRERIGIVLQETGVERFLRVAEVLELYCGYYPHPRPVDELLALTGLEEKRNEIVKLLSGGQRRRLDLALALIGDPDVLFLDEPTTGFDPHARRQAWTTIRSLCDLGKTVFLTTHYMDEAQHLADRVAVMVAGKIVAIGPPESIAGRDEQPTEIRFVLPDGISLADLPPLPAAAIDEDHNGVLITTRKGVSAIHELTGWALERGLPLARLSLSQPTLEDIYLALTAAGEPEEALR